VLSAKEAAMKALVDRQRVEIATASSYVSSFGGSASSV